MTEFNEYEDKEYVAARDKLIPIAAKYAGKQHLNETNKYEWDRTFILKMDRMAVEAGIQGCHYHYQDKDILQL